MFLSKFVALEHAVVQSQMKTFTLKRFIQRNIMKTLYSLICGIFFINHTFPKQFILGSSSIAKSAW